MQRATKKSRATKCQAYRMATDDVCEVSRWLVADRDAAKWMSGVKLVGFEVHHIEGRKVGESEQYCNLILVSAAAHDWGHDRHPNEFELACLYAKYRKHLAYLADCKRKRKELVEEHLWDWHPERMGGVVKTGSSLEQRLSYLMGKVTAGSIYAAYGAELLAELNDGDLTF